VVYLRISRILFLIFYQKKKKRRNILDGRGKIVNFIKSFLEESLLLQPSVTLVNLFCDLKIFTLSGECPRPIIHKS
jgi:hypothetical protein